MKERTARETKRQRSYDLLLAGYFLSRCSEVETGMGNIARPPGELGVPTWQAAYEIFYPALGAGRSIRTFHNTLKNTRDEFDPHFENGRAGWFSLDGKPKYLNEDQRGILSFWQGRSRQELFVEVAKLITKDGGTGNHSNISATEEGRLRYYMCKVRERVPKLRAKAINYHGCFCQVCGFDFEKSYGPIGTGFIEVHHVVPLSMSGKTVTVPETDLLPVCANCHRIIHRAGFENMGRGDLKSAMQPRNKP